MFNIFSGPRLAIVLMSAGLLSCSAGNGDRQEGTTPANVYGAEEKRIAQSLSVGSRSLLNLTQNPYERALLCQVSLESVAPRLSAVIDAEQSALIESARRVFEQRLRAAAAELGKSLTQIAADTATLEDGADPSKQARLALACLRDLT